MRQEFERRAEAIVGVLVDEAAERRQEAARLCARVVKDAGRAPAIGAAHDRGRAVFLLHTKKLGSSKIERALPRYRYEALAAAAGAALGPARQVAFAHHRAHDASLRIHRFGQRLD